MKALFVTMDAGGNLPPALNIAREIVRRGGSVEFLGHEPQRAAIEGAASGSNRFGSGARTTPRRRAPPCRRSAT